MSLILIFVGKVRVISPSRIVARRKRIILRIGLWSWKSIHASILELILNWPIEVVLVPLKIPHEVDLLKRCTPLTFHAIMISTTEVTD